MRFGALTYTTANAAFNFVRSANAFISFLNFNGKRNAVMQPETAPGAANTAFHRRDGTQYCIQYLSSWQNASQSGAHLTNVANVYAAIHPYLPGAAYVNYCDLDLQNSAEAYWGANLTRLSSVKAAYDASNLFRHQQSVPVGTIV